MKRWYCLSNLHHVKNLYPSSKLKIKLETIYCRKWSSGEASRINDMRKTKSNGPTKWEGKCLKNGHHGLALFLMLRSKLICFEPKMHLTLGFDIENVNILWTVCKLEPSLPSFSCHDSNLWTYVLQLRTSKRVFDFCSGILVSYFKIISSLSSCFSCWNIFFSNSSFLFKIKES